MTPKEKAQDLWLRYYELIDDDYSNEAAKKMAKEYAQIAVDEILKVAEPSTEQVQYTNGEWAREYREIPNRYWTEVKQEIETFKTKEK